MAKKMKTEHGRLETVGVQRYRDSVEWKNHSNNGCYEASERYIMGESLRFTNNQK